jgi:hypothetical protein
MKKILTNLKCRLGFVLIFLLLSTLTKAAIFTSRNSGDWTDPCTWSNVPSCSSLTAIEGVTIPGIMDDVVISGKDVITVTGDVYIHDLTFNNGSGAQKTTLNIFGALNFIISGSLIMESQTIMYVDGGAFINVMGDICVKNDGNIAAQGVGPTIGGKFIVNGCATVGSTNCEPGGSGTPNFINSTYLIYCIACAANSANMYEGTPGSCYTTMPVTVLSFKATFTGSTQGRNSKVNLTWITTSELDNAYFTIERSADGLQFTELVHIESQSFTSTVASYQATDDQPLPGKSYYRLKQTDKNGKISYGKTIAVQKPAQISVTLLPNPLSSNTLYISHNLQEKISLIFMDMLGQRISPSAYSTITENDGLIVTFIENISPGLYTVQVSNGSSSVTKKLIVQ